jgi:hypothetical protein
MGDDRRDARSTDYHHARVGAAAALVAVVVFILVFDAVSVEYEASPIILAALLGTIGALMGLEIRADFRK